MEKFEKLKSTITPLNIENVDTDQIIPARFLKAVSRDGFGENLFRDWRYRSDGSLNNDFILNKNPYKNTKILVAGDNFGCGSSREHAPWALSDFGIKCVISTSFADIFYNNSFKNGLLPIVVTKDERDALLADSMDDENPELSIDLETQTIKRPNGASIKFKIDPFRKKCLLEGLDDIGLTRQKSEEIKKFEESRDFKRPWL